MERPHRNRTSTTPELLLARLHQTLSDLLSSLAYLELPKEDREIVDRIRTEAKSVLVSKVLFDTAAIAVTGLQGVGKSTLVSQLYDLPSGMLPVSLGRDEKVPVLFLEHSGSLELGCIRIGGEELTSSQSLSREEFTRLAVDPQQDLAMLTVRTPTRLFGDHRQGLIMLPGIESSLEGDVARRPTGWEGLVHHALLSAASCVFVVTPTLLADDSNRETLEKVKERFKGMAPIVVISNADRFGDDNMAGYVETAAEMAGVSVQDVIVTGTTPELAAKAGESMRRALARGTGTHASFRALQLNELAAMSRDRLADALSEIRFAIADLTDDIETDKHRSVDAVIERFDRSAKKLRKKLAKALDERLTEHAREANDSIRKLIAEEDWTSKLARLFCDPSLKERTKLEQMLASVWMQAGQGLSNTVQSVLSEQAIAELEPYTGHSTKSFSGPRAMPLLQGKEEQWGLAFVMGQGDEQKPEDARKLGVSLNKAPALLALMGWAVKGAIPRSIDGGIVGQSLPTRIDMDAVFRGVEAAGEAKKRTLATIATAVLGADVAADGTVDLLPAVAGKLGFEMTAAAANILALAGGVFVLASMAVSVRNQVVKSDLTRADAAGLAIDSMKESTIARALDGYDKLIDLFRHHLTVKMNQAHKFDERWSSVQYAQLMVSRAQFARQNLVAALERSLASNLS